MARIPKRARSAGRPEGRFTQFRRLEGMRELLSDKPVGVSIEELAGALRVTHRSVRRYLSEMKNELSLETVTTVPGGPLLWRIAPSEKGRAISLRRTQAYLLFAVRGAFDTLRGSALFDEIDVAVRELLHLAQRPLKSKQGVDIREGQRFEERIVFTHTPARTYSNKSGEMDDLFRAVAELREVNVRYRTAERAERLTCHPYALFIDRGDAKCLAKEDGKLRVLLVEHIEATEVLENRFSLPADFEPNHHVHPICGVLADPDSRRALIEIDSAIGMHIRSRKLHPAQRIGTAADGRVRLSLPIGEVHALAKWVLSLGGAARVIEPADLISSVREMTETLARKHRQ